MLNALGFLAHECWLNVRRQGVAALACVSSSAAALTVLGLFVLVAWHVQTIADALPRQFEIHAFVADGAPREQADELVSRVQGLPGVVRVRLIPREAAWDEYQKQYPRKADLEALGDNPLPDKLEVVTASPEATLRVAEQVRDMSGIEHVNEGRELLRSLMSIAGIVRMTGLAMAALLALATSVLVGNGIRLTLFARRRDIRVMQLVGATNGFIRLPFLLEGIAVGAVGAAIACALTIGGLHYLSTRVLPDVPFVNEFRLAVDVPLYCAALIAGGAALGMFGSLLSLRKFLRTP